MNSFLIETHAHTAEVSTCAFLNAQDVVSAYIAEGYNGIVITNHLSVNTFRTLTSASRKEKIEYFLKGYHNAKSFAGNCIEVFLGLEVSFPNDPNDYLVYGVDEDFLFYHDSLYELDIKRFQIIAKENNLLVFQAHPFRRGMRVSDSRDLDGIEVYNGNSSHNSNNEIADLWAETHHLMKISGSDFHYFFGMHPGGIIVYERITTNAELVEALRKGNYRLK